MSLRKNISLVLLFTLVIVVMYLVMPSTSFAEPPGEGDPAVGIVNPLKIKTLDAFVKELVIVARNIGMLVAVLGIVYAGMLKVTARGDEEKLKKAQSAFLWSVIGTAVLLGAWLIATAIQGTIMQIETGASLWHNFKDTWLS